MYDTKRQKKKISDKLYYIRNKTKINKYNKVWIAQHKEELSIYNKEYRIINKDRISKQRKEYRILNKEKIQENRLARRTLINSYKIYCIRCKKIYDPVCLDFHHRDPAIKKEKIAWMKNCSIETILNEIKKCDVVCSNCHMEITKKGSEFSKHHPKWFINYLKSLKCSECSTNKSLIFHHINPATKLDSINNMLKLHKKKELILQEIKKCIVLCSNCHRLIHKKNNI